MGKRYSESQVEALIQKERPYISIVKGSFTGITFKCIFLDSVFGTWTTTPEIVLRGSDHPLRMGDKIRKASALPLEEVKNRLPSFITIKEETYISCAKSAVFIDEIYGEWSATPDKVLRNRRHPKRSKAVMASKLTISIEEAKSRLPPELTLVENTFKNTHTPCSFIDNKYGEWQALPFNVFRGHSHPSRTCTGTSKIEQKLYSILKDLNLEVKHRYKIDKVELDFYFPEFNLGIELDGLYYHSKEYKKDTHHLNKREFLNSKGIEVLFFREDEWNFKEDLVISMIKVRLGLTKKVFARNLIVKDVSHLEAMSFLEANHLMGKISARHLGLYTKDNQLVSLLGYKKHKSGLDITRFCSKMDLIVVGGLSKLLSKVKLDNLSADYIQSWVDRRYGNGKSLIKTGFAEEHTTLGWKWTNFKKTFNRLYCRANMDERGLSEKEYATEMKLYKIYDAGQTLFKLNLK